MEFDVEAISPRERYALLIASILPRPIAWVSTVSQAGVTNLAPFSFFTGITGNPMSLCFAPVNSRDGVAKDTLVNVRETGEFVVNVVTEDNVEKANLTSATYPHGVSEFEKAGLTPVPSVLVKPPRVKESPIHMECRVLQIVTVSDGALGGNLVIGKVVRFHADDSLLRDGALPHDRVRAVGRLEGAWYSRTREAFELARPK